MLLQTIQSCTETVFLLQSRGEYIASTSVSPATLQDPEACHKQVLYLYRTLGTRKCHRLVLLQARPESMGGACCPTAMVFNINLGQALLCALFTQTPWTDLLCSNLQTLAGRQWCRRTHLHSLFLSIVCSCCRYLQLRCISTQKLHCLVIACSCIYTVQQISGAASSAFD